MENSEDKTISSILERLSKIEAELSQIKNAVSSKINIQPRQTIAAGLPTAKEKSEKPALVKSRKTSIESAIGTKWIGRVGMLAIVFGVAFFLKYSFDNRLIGETGRIILGIISGVSFIGVGEYFQKKKHWGLYGQIFTGGGLAILFFSIYAAYAFYHLISQILAFAALAVITATGITLSVRYSSLTTAVIGMLGGFLTPVMLSTGENRPVSLFSYILLLDTGILSVVYFKQWRSIYLLSLIGTIFMYTAWHERFYTPGQQQLAFGIITVFFLLYNLYVLFANYRGKSSFTDQAAVFLSAAFYLIAFDAQNQHIKDWDVKSFILILSFAQIMFAGIGLKLFPDFKRAIYSFAGASAVLNVLSIFIIFEKEWISAALAAEMAVFAYIGIRLNKFPMRVLSYALGVVSIARFIEEVGIHLGPFDKFTLILNSRFLICSFIIAAFYGMLYLLSKNRTGLSKNEEIIMPGTLIITQILSVALLSIEFYDFYRFPFSHRYLAFAEFRYASQLSLSIIWAIYASALVSAGIIKKIRLLRMLGIVLIGITIIKVFFVDLAELKTLYRIISFVILGLLLLTVSYFYNRYKHKIFGEDKHD